MTVVNIKNPNKMDKIKIDGEKFERIKGLLKAQEQIKQDIRDELEALKEKRNKIHYELWSTLYEVTGINKNTEEPYNLNTEYEELGFYIVEKESDEDMPELLKTLLK